jgi:transposase
MVLYFFQCSFLFINLNLEIMRKIREKSAGIDIGSKHIFVSIENQEVRSFETFTESFREATNYLLLHDVQSVAMEATGVYWIVLYEMLEKSGIDVWLVDGRQTRQVPGRKTDVKDCQWIQQLHSFGLLNRCFVPDNQIKEIRSYHRLREDHIRSAATSIHHMQKALIEMNIRLKESLSQIHGYSGLSIIEAILAGERDRNKLLSLCHKSIIKNKANEVLKALEGHYTEAGLFSLQQAYNTYKFYQIQIKECDFQIQQVLEKINDNNSNDENQKNIKSAKGRKPIRHNAPEIKFLGGHLLQIFGGIDATQLPGITDYTWLQLYTETGDDLTKWATEKHFTSWLGLAPGQHKSGKMRKNKNKKYRPKAGQIFRQISQTLIESKKIALGAFGRRLKSKRGPGIAIKATARKLAELYWRLHVKGLEFVENGINKYEEKVKLQKEKWLFKNAKSLGYEIINKPN